MKFILIIYVFLIGGGGITTAEFTAEFNTLEACEHALEMVIEDSPYQSIATCVPKGQNYETNK